MHPMHENFGRFLATGTTDSVCQLVLFTLFLKLYELYGWDLYKLPFEERVKILEEWLKPIQIFFPDVAQTIAGLSEKLRDVDGRWFEIKTGDLEHITKTLTNTMLVAYRNVE